MMSSDIIEKDLMSKINISKDKMALRNIFVTFESKEDEERLCNRIRSALSGRNLVYIDKIVESIGIRGILSTMGIDPSTLNSNVDVRCLPIVKSISFSSLPDAMILAIAQVASNHNITNISEIGEVIGSRRITTVFGLLAVSCG